MYSAAWIAIIRIATSDYLINDNFGIMDITRAVPEVSRPKEMRNPVA